MKIKNFIKKCIVYLLLISTIIYTTPVWALTKKESVYAKLNSDGSTKSIIASEHLTNIENDIVDKSKLENITNVNGDEKFTKDGNKIVWENKGNDIYYQGDFKDKLPIEVSVKYYLNDEISNVKSMLGKKGNIKIVLEYKNNDSHTALINNIPTTLYTPFVVATTTIIDNSHNKNIKISNGKIIDNGTNSILVGITSPGLYDSLNIEELKDFNKIEISYDTDSFELNSIYSLATAKLLDDNDLDISTNIKELYSSIGLLQSNMDKLVNASNLLNNGSKMIANGTEELNQASKRLSKTYYEYRNTDNKKLKEGIRSVVNDNVKLILPALRQSIIDETVKSIKNNKSRIEKSVVQYSKDNIKELINKEIDKALKSINVDNLINEIINSDLRKIILEDETIYSLTTVFEDELEKVLKNEIKNTTNATIEQMADNINNNMSQEEKESYINSIANKYNISYEQAAQIVLEVQNDTIKGIKSNIKNSSNTISESVSDTIINNIKNKDYIENLVNTYITNVNNRIAYIIANDSKINQDQKELINKIADELKKELSKEEILNKYSEASNYVNNIIDSFIQKTAEDIADEYTEEIAIEVVNNVINDQMKEETINSELSAIINAYEKDINNKLKIADENVNKAVHSIGLLNNGTHELANGMNLFNIGINRYNNEGIKKISKLVNGDVKEFEEKIEKLISYSEEYSTLDDNNSDEKCESKIIMVIEEVKKDKKEKEAVETADINTKKSFWEKIKGLIE